MRSKLAISALMVAALFGSTAIASAQTESGQSAPAASGEGKVGTGSAMSHHKSIKSTHHVKPGVTTGMSTRSSQERSKPGGQSTAHKPAAN
jgi:opacity protein-like surface antigen